MIKFQANGKILKEEFLNKLYIQPASGDAGGALGAALAANYIYFDSERLTDKKTDSMKGTYLGPSYSEKEVISMSKKVKAKYQQIYIQIIKKD